MDRKLKRRQISEQFIFSWLPERNTARTLAAFAIFSVVIHFLGFYLFQVVYPEPVRNELRPNQIFLLDAKNADVRAFLDRVRDRNIFLEPTSVNAISRVKLSDHAIRFVPSFAETRPTLKRPSDAPGIGEFPIPAPTSRRKFGEWKNPVTFSPNLVKRGIAPSTIFDDYLDFVPRPLPRIRVNLTVPPSGIPGHVDIIGGTSEEDEQILIEYIQRTLRFEPTPEEEGADPGWMELGSSPESR